MTPPAETTLRIEQTEDQSTRETLEDFARATSGWFWAMDADLRFTYFSDTVTDITGVAPDWHYGKTRAELGLPARVSESAWKAHLETLQRREPFHDFVFERRGPDGDKWMQTSGVPVFGPGGEFRGYRGTAFDVTARVHAERMSERLMAALENLSELFALWDPDDRLVYCNEQFREMNKLVPESTEPGISFEDHLRAGMAAGHFPQAAAEAENWLAQRLAHHQNPSVPLDLRRQDDRWLLLTEQRLMDGSTTTISTDITAHKRAEQRLAEQHEVLDAALKTIPDGLQVMDDELRLIAYNDQLFEVLDLDRDAIVNDEHPGLAFQHALAVRGDYGSGDLAELIGSRRAIVRSGMKINYEWQLASGKWVECRGNPVQGGGYVAVYRDISERKIFIAALEDLAATDALTGALNRRKFLEVAEAELGRAHRFGRPASTLLLDVDHFKSVNDRFGHATGDEALKHIVKVTGQLLREQDSLGRLGGEEFAILLPEIGQRDAAAVADRLREGIKQSALETAEGSLVITVSIGVAELREGLSTAEALIAAADQALYQAKRQGRDQVVEAGLQPNPATPTAPSPVGESRLS